MAKTEREFLHDISTPVATILFLIESSIEMAADPTQKTRLEKVQKKILEIKTLVEDRRIEIKTAVPK